MQMDHGPNLDLLYCILGVTTVTKTTESEKGNYRSLYIHAEYWSQIHVLFASPVR